MAPRKKKETTETHSKEEHAEKKHKKAEAKPQATQPELNIGLIGHVDHGKTTLVQTLSGKWTDTHSEEMKRGITIRLGYADVSIYKYPGVKGAEAFGTKETDPKTGTKGEFQRKISLVDAPGHESLMATMLSGANIMDGALLLVGANETCPQAQTREHVQALEIIGIQKIIVIQNKIDLVPEEQAIKNYNEIKAFLAETKYKDAPIVPISAFHNINIDTLLETIEKEFPTPKRDETQTPLMFVARSFDINKPGSTPDKMVGGVIGGELKQGKLVEGMEVVIVPGYEVQERNQKIWKPLRTKVVSLMSGGQKVPELLPGGSMAFMTTLDPSVVKSDKLMGSLVGIEGKTPPVRYELQLETHLLERVVGAKDKLVVEPVKKGEPLLLNVNAAPTVGVVSELGKNTFKCLLRRPICADKDAKVAISRNLGQRWRLIGFGVIK